MEDCALGNIIRGAARAVRRDSRRNWKRNGFHRSDRDLEEVVAPLPRAEHDKRPVAPTAP